MDRRRFLVSSALVPATAIAGPNGVAHAPTVADLAFDLRLIAWSSKEALSYAEKMIVDRKLDAMSMHVPAIGVAKRAFQEEGFENPIVRFHVMFEAKAAGALDRPTYEKLVTIAC